MKRSVEQIEIPQCVKKSQIYLAYYVPEYHECWIFKPRCWCWNCETCATARMNYWAKRVYSVINARIEAGEDWYFITITSHANCKTFNQTRFILSKNFHKLRKRMEREKPGMLYIAIPEKHKDGRLHVHLLSNANMRTSWYKDACAETGFGYIAESTKLENAAKAAFYVTKYITKALASEHTAEGQDFFKGKRFQRVRASKDFPDLENDTNFTKREVVSVGNYEQLQVFLMQLHYYQYKVYYSETGEEL